ncbi:MAG: hypothetical protein ACOYXT_07570 [Bacteroidota bacterium]
MKKLLVYVLVLMVMASCTKVVLVNTKPKSPPPGQVKKATGSKSAKPYAPGQQKKKN